MLVVLSGLRLAFDPMQMYGRAASQAAPAIASGPPQRSPPSFPHMSTTAGATPLTHHARATLRQGDSTGCERRNGERSKRRENKSLPKQSLWRSVESLASPVVEYAMGHMPPIGSKAKAALRYRILPSFRSTTSRHVRPTCRPSTQIRSGVSSI